MKSKPQTWWPLFLSFLLTLYCTSVLAGTIYDARSELATYARASIFASESAHPSFVPLPKASAAERAAVFASLRERWDQPLLLWEAALLDGSQLRLLKNEIYARHGMKFKSADLVSWFSKFPWYREDAGYSDLMLSKTERENASLLKRLESVKSDSGSRLPNPITIPGLALQEVKGSNEHVSVIKGKVSFAKSGKTMRLAHKVTKDDTGQLLFTNFERMGMFVGLPLVFVQAWQTEHAVSGETSPVGLKVFDLDGNRVKGFTSVAGNLYYNKELGAIFSYSQDGCCGVSVGTATAMKPSGQVTFGSVFGVDSDANGYLDFARINWGNALLAWIRNNVKESGANSLEFEDRIVVFGKGGQPLVDLRLPPQTLDDAPNGGLDLKQLVQLTPEIAYAISSEGSDTREALIYLAKPLP